MCKVISRNRGTKIRKAQQKNVSKQKNSQDNTLAAHFPQIRMTELALMRNVLEL
jgi:hypothetical protein